MKFSIGIPAYKSRFLRECIGSILNQAFSDFELIIVNDASPENIDGILGSFKDERISYYKNKKNVGAESVVDNWNKCLSYATGEYFVLMGDDDVMAPNYLEEFDRLIQKYPSCEVYHCRAKIIDEQSNFITLSEARPEFESVYESMWHRISGKRLQYVSDFVYHTETLKNNMGFYKLPLAWASDDVTAYIASMEKGVANTNNPVFLYRINSQTISNVGKLELKLQAIKEEENWLREFIEKENPQNETDKYLYQMIKDKLPNYFAKKRVYTLSSNLTRIHYLKIKSLLKLLREHGISISLLIYAIIILIKDKRKAASL